MSVLIKNGHIFTAVDNYVADILVDDGKIRTIGIDLTADAEKTIDATGKYVIPGGIDPHTHLDFPFGGTVSSDDFSTGTIAAAVGGTTSIVDFVVQQRGQALTEALEIWHQKAEGQAAIDYGFHMIVQDLPDHRLSEMDEMVRQGVTSFKMFMAYRGAVMVDDDTIFKAMVRASDNGALICLHAEHGHMIDVLVQQALAQGDTAPRFHASTRPAGDRGGGHPPGDTHGGDCRRSGLFRAPELHRGPGAGAGGPLPAELRLCRDLPPLPDPGRQHVRPGGFRGGQVRTHSAVCGTRGTRTNSGRDCVATTSRWCPRTTAPSGSATRRPWDSTTFPRFPTAGLGSRTASACSIPTELTPGLWTLTGWWSCSRRIRPALRPLPPQGHHSRGQRRRHRGVRPRRGDGDQRPDPPHERGLQPVRGDEGEGRARDVVIVNGRVLVENGRAHRHSRQAGVFSGAARNRAM